MTIIIPDKYDQGKFHDIVWAYYYLENNNNEYYTVSSNLAAYILLHHVLFYPSGDPGWHWMTRFQRINQIWTLIVKI